MSAADSPSDVLLRYYAALDAGDEEAAVAAFAPDAVYVRPVKVSTGTGVKARQLHVSRGREEIRRFIDAQAELAREQGRTVVHRIVGTAAGPADCFLEGYIPSPDGGPQVSFIAHATLDGDGLISRYVATVTEGPDEGIPGT